MRRDMDMLCLFLSFQVPAVCSIDAFNQWKHAIKIAPSPEKCVVQVSTGLEFDLNKNNEAKINEKIKKRIVVLKLYENMTDLYKLDLLWLIFEI